MKTGVGNIKSTPAAGGSVTTLLQRPDGIRFFAYDSAGEAFVYSAGGPSIFYRTPAGGGESEPLFDLESDNETYHYWASFATPFAPQVMMFDFGAFAVPRSMAAVDLESGRRLELGGGFWPTYSPSGHIIYEASQRDGLWAVPFSLDELEAGDPFRIEERGLRPSVSTNGTLAFVEPQYGGLEQLVWKNRSGEVVGRIGQPQNTIAVPKLSPDETRVAVQGQDQPGPRLRDVWVHDVRSRVKTRITFGPENEDRSAWLPDGDRIAISSQRGDSTDLFVVRPGSGEPPELLLDDEGSQFPYDWTPDGRTLVYATPPQDIWVLQIGDDGETKTRPLIADQFDTYAPTLSQDGLYLAYVSDESGRDEVYVRPLDDPLGRTQVSVDGGAQPRWRGDGRELYYIESGALIAASIAVGPRIQVGAKKKLFSDAEAFAGRGQTYDVTRDGQRFVVVETVERPPPPKIRVVQNWFAKYQGDSRAD